jgi:hypothetical protein
VTDIVSKSEGQAEVEVRAALERAGLQANSEQLMRLVKTYRHMDARLAVLRRHLDPDVPPVLVFPAAVFAPSERQESV